MIPPELAALAASFSFGVAPLLYKKSLESIHSSEANLFRSLGAAVPSFLALFMASDLDRYITSVQVWGLVGSGCILALGINGLVYFKSVDLVGASRATTLSSVFPLFIIPFSLFLLGEPATLPIVCGTIAIVIGIWFMGRGLDFESNRRFMRVGIMLGLVSALLWAVGTFLFKLALFYIDAFTFVFLRMWILLPFVGALTLIPHSRRPTRRNTFACAFLGGMLDLGIGAIFMYYALKIGFANVVVPLSSTYPVVTTVLAYVFLKESISVKSLAGVLLVVTGTVALVLR